MQPTSTPATPDQCRDWPQAGIVGDLDLDGRRDVVTITCYWKAGDQASLVARSGSDGHVLWSYSFRPGSAAFIETAPLVAGVGVQVLVAGIDYEGVYAVGLDGGGRALWQRTYLRGTTGGSPDETTTDAPSGVAFLSAAGLPGNDVMLTTYDQVQEQPMPTNSAATAEIIDGATGLTMSTVTRSTTGDPALTVVLSDSSLPGGDDFAFVEPGGYDRDSVLAAHDGRDGAKLWARHRLPVSGSSSSYIDLGDVTGDGIREIALRELHEYSDSAWPTTLLDGATGRPLWMRYLQPFRSTDSDGDGIAEVGATVSATDALLVQAIDAAGQVVAESRFATPGWGGWAQPLGDLDEDGHAEFLLPVVGRRIVVSGSQRTQLWQLEGETLSYVEPLAASLDGAGDDLLATTWESYGQARFDAVDGTTGRLLWTLPPHPFGRPPDLNDAGDVTGDGVADLLLVQDDEQYRPSLVLIDGRDGTTIWTVAA